MHAKGRAKRAGLQGLQGGGLCVERTQREDGGERVRLGGGQPALGRAERFETKKVDGWGMDRGERERQEEETERGRQSGQGSQALPIPFWG